MPRTRSLSTILLVLLAATPLYAQPMLKPKPAPTTSAIRPEIKVVHPEIRATRPAAQFDTEGRVTWTTDIKNMGQDPIPPGNLRYMVFQSKSGSQPVLVQTGFVSEHLEPRQITPLKGAFAPCCGYNQVLVEIWSKPDGRKLSSMAGPIPIAPARAAIKIYDIDYNSKARILTPRLSNTSSMPITVRIEVYVKKLNQTYWTFTGERTIAVTSIGMSVPFRNDAYTPLTAVRIKLSQFSPPNCPAEACCTYKTWEDYLVDLPL